MLNCLRNHPKPETRMPANPKPVADKEILVAWLEGHTWNSPGADNYLGESEKVFSHRIGSKVIVKVNEAGYGLIRLQRPEGPYKHQCNYIADKAAELKITHILSSHFNSADSNAKGAEALVPPTASIIDNLMADMFTDLLNIRLGFKERGDDGAKLVYSGHNGFLMLDKISDKGIFAIILEATFAHWRHAESIAIFENEDAYVDIIVELIIAIYTGTLRDLDEV